MIIGDVRRLVNATPIVPLTIHLADGGQLRVPSVDHIAVSPAGARVVVFADDDTVVHVFPLLISRVTVDAVPARA